MLCCFVVCSWMFRWWQAVLDSEQGRVVGAAIDEIINGVRRAKFNRFVPQAYLPLNNLPPPKVRYSGLYEY